MTELQFAILLLIFLAAVPFYYSVVNGSVRYPTLPNLTFLVHFLYPVGMFTISAQLRIWDPEWVTMNLAGPISMVAGALVANLLFRFDPRREWDRFCGTPVATDLTGISYGFVLGGVVLVSIGVMVTYLLASGENMALAALASLLSGDDVQYVTRDLIQKRKSLTAGIERYWAPGYLKQFRDVLLPCATMLVYCRWKGTGSRSQKWLFWCLFPATFYFIISSGQRGPLFLYLFAFCLVASHFLRRDRLVRWKVPKPLLAVMVLSFVLLTYLLGRMEAAEGPLEAVAQGCYNLYDRIVLTVPRENICSKPVWEQLGPLRGQGWWDGLMQILPGTQHSIYNDLHSYLGGSEHGNSVLNLWADGWMNFGMAGIPVIGFVFGFWLQWIHVRLVRGRHRSARRLVHYSFLTSIMPTVTQPVSLLIQGGLSLFLLFLLLHIGDSLEPRRRRRVIGLGQTPAIRSPLLRAGPRHRTSPFSRW